MSDVYECTNCGAVVGENSKFCAGCGSSLNKKGLGALSWFAIAVVLMAVIGVIVSASSQRGAAKTPEQIEDGRYLVASYACEQWTKDNAAVGADEFTDRYRLDRKPDDRPDWYRAEVIWRAKGEGLLMYSDCLAWRTGDDQGTTKVLSGVSGHYVRR
jgi:RNA polymerase subunit RPABC4/transcription elongation factor Spt4